MDALDVIMVMDNDYASYQAAMGIAREAMSNHDSSEKTPTYWESQEAGSEISDYVREWYADVLKISTELPALLILQMFDTIDWTEVGKHFCQSVIDG